MKKITSYPTTVNFYCHLSVLTMDKHNAEEYLTKFLSDISDTIQVLVKPFCIVWGKSDLAPEPNILLPSFDEEGDLTLPFSFQYSHLEQAVLRIGLLKSFFENIAYHTDIDVQFEYYLEDF